MKNSIFKSIFFTLLSMQQVSMGNQFHFPKDMTIFLDTNKVANLSDNIYPYIYMFNDQNQSDTWVKMEQCDDNSQYYFRCIVPEDKYSGLIFAFQKVDDKGWNNCNIQTCNLMYSDFNRNKNCYTLHNDSEEINGTWKTSKFNSKETLMLEVKDETLKDSIKDKYPYVYMFNNHCEHEWIKMVKSGNYYFGIIPSNKYSKLLFTFQNEDICDWNKKTHKLLI